MSQKRLTFLLVAALCLCLSNDLAHGDDGQVSALYAVVLFSRPAQQTPLGYADPARSVGLFIRTSVSDWRNLHHPNVFSYGLGYYNRDTIFRMYLAGGNGLHRSSDGGKTWKVLTGWSTEDILSVAPHPDNPAVVYISTPFGIYKTDDDGKSWVERMTGMRRWFVQRVRIDVLNADMLYAAAEDDLYRSVDGGMTWKPMEVGAPQILEVVQHSTQPATLFVGTEDHGVYVSHDGGSSWLRGDGIPASAIYCIAISPGGDTAYAGGYRTGLWRSLDRGRFWQRIEIPAKIEAIYAVTINPANKDHIVIGTNGEGVFESFDGGITWNHAGLFGAHIQQVEFIPYRMGE